MKLRTFYLLSALLLVPLPTKAQMEKPITRTLEAVNPDLEDQELYSIVHAVLKFSNKYDLKPELVTAIILVESSANILARSPKGAVGLMQVMPSMLRRLDMHGRTIESNIEAGCLILSDNIRRMGEHDGISAYYWGPRIRNKSYLIKVQKAQKLVQYHRSAVEQEVKELQGEDL